MCCVIVNGQQMKMSTRFTYLLLLKLPRNTTNNAVWLSSLHRVDLSENGRKMISVRKLIDLSLKHKTVEALSYRRPLVTFKGYQCSIRWRRNLTTTAVVNDQFAMKIDWESALFWLFIPTLSDFVGCFTEIYEFFKSLIDISTRYGDRIINLNEQLNHTSDKI